MTVTTGWDQCHYEDYQIFFPNTINGSKSKLKRLRYLENRKKSINTLPEAITFDPTIGFSISFVFWKLDIQSFLGAPRLVQSKSGKAFKDVSEVELGKGQTAYISRVAGGPSRCAES